MNESQVFIRALELGSAAQRSAYLDEVCGADGDLRRGVEALLAVHDSDPTFLEQSPPTGDTFLDPPVSLEQRGATIGPYKLLQQIGEGGMGSVYMAEQSHPVKRTVALKIIKPGMDSRQIIARFEAERQALAMMDHANIARVLDAGATERGLPYFVMELVHGVPITQYCDENQLTPRERMQLFAPVCDAIQHAHQKGIIHRDIKPSNVMVTLYDGRPVPKVIDFGVAKATEQRLTERTLFTQYGTMIGTLEYMSPEQAETSALGVDTRSDIYSLGVLLYELLTGSTPLTHKRISEVAYPEILRLIREEEPPRPSTRVNDSGETLASISTQRRTEPSKLSKMMRGELDWIVMKSLEKDRNRRYESASGLAADVRRYLNDEPVQACPPSTGYRLRKFATKNKRILATGALLGTMLLVGIVLLAINNVQIQREQARTATALGDAKDNLELADENLTLALRALDEIYMKEVEKRVREKRELNATDRQFLEEGLRFYEQFGQNNGTQAGLQSATAKANRRAGYLQLELQQWPEGAALFRKAVPILKGLVEKMPHSEEHRRELASTLHGLAFALRNMGMLPEAEQVCRQAINMWQALIVEFPAGASHRPALGHSEWLLREILSDRGQHANAEAAARRALELFQQLQLEFPNDPYFRQEMAYSYRVMSDNVSAQGRKEETVELRQHSASLYASLAKEFPTNLFYQQELAHVQAGVGFALAAVARNEEAEAAFLQAVDVNAKLVEDAPPEKMEDYRQRLAWSEGDLSRHYAALKRFADAEQHAHRSLELHRQIATSAVGTAYHWLEVAKQAYAVAQLVQTSGQSEWQVRHAFDHAAAAYQDALAKYEALVATYPTPANRWQVAFCQGYLGESLRMAGRLEEASVVWRESVPIQEELTEETAIESQIAGLAIRHDQLGNLFDNMKRPLDAEAEYRKALAIWRKLVAEYHKSNHRASLASTQQSLTGILANIGKLDEAAELAREFNDDSSQNIIAWRIVRQPQPDPAAVKLAIDLAERVVANKPDQGYIVNTLGVAYYRAGDWRNALETLMRADDLMGGSFFGSNALFIAMTQWQLGNRETAIQWYTAALLWTDRYSPSDEEVLGFRTEAATLLGVSEVLSLAHQQIPKDSVELYNVILAARPDAAWPYGKRGRVYMTQNEDDKAIADFTRAIELQPNAWLHWADRGTSQRRLKQFDAAFADLSEALQRNDQIAWVWDERAQTQVSQELYDEALADYSQAIELDSKDANYWNRRGVAYEKHGQVEQALADYTQATKLSPSTVFYWHNLADLNSRMGQYEKAIAARTKLLEITPGHAYSWNARGVAHSHLGQDEQALADYRQATELNPNEPLYWGNSARVLVKLKRYEDALEHFSVAIELVPDNADVWNRRGVAHKRLGHEEQAYCDYAKATDLNPTNVQYWRNRGDQSITLGDYASAVTEFSTALELDPKRDDSWNHRGVAYNRLGQYEPALADYVQATELNPAVAIYWQNRAFAEARLGRQQEALASFSAALERDPQDHVSWNGRGTASFILGRWESARSDHSRALELAPQIALYWRNRGWSYARLKEPELAIADASKSIELEPNVAIPWHLRGSCRAELGERAVAASDLARAFELSPESPFIGYQAALMCLELEDAKGYRQYCSKLLASLKPNSTSTALEWAVWSCVLAPDAVIDWRTPLNLARSNVAAQPKNYRPLHHLGAAHYRAGNYGEALLSLMEAEAAVQEDSKMDCPQYNWLFLAMVNHRLNERDEARRWLERARTSIDHDLARVSSTSTAAESVPWNRRATLTLLLREAETLLNCDKTWWEQYLETGSMP